MKFDALCNTSLSNNTLSVDQILDCFISEIKQLKCKFKLSYVICKLFSEPCYIKYSR